MVTHAKSEEKENKMGGGDTGAEREMGAKRNRYGVRWRRKYTPKGREMERQIRGKMKIPEESEKTDKTEEDGLVDAHTHTHRRERGGLGRVGKMRTQTERLR